MKKISKEGVYTRELGNGDIAYIITYRANNKTIQKENRYKITRMVDT